MSPKKCWEPAAARVASALTRATAVLGADIRAERVKRHWTQAKLAQRAGISAPLVHHIESGKAGSSEACFRIAAALSMELDVALRDARRVAADRDRNVDPVHAAMGEIEAAHLRPIGHHVALDEPYQHYQFAGRADLVAVDVERKALLHIENRTRFPDIQGFAGSWNAKRAYLAAEVAPRLGIAALRNQTHVVVALCSSEVLHALRLREETFRSLCPDPPDAFRAWWSGTPPGERGSTSSLVILDPLPGRRTSPRRWVGLDLVRTIVPRYRGYAEALAALREAHLA